MSTPAPGTHRAQIGSESGPHATLDERRPPWIQADQDAGTNAGTCSLSRQEKVHPPADLRARMGSLSRGRMIMLFAVAVCTEVVKDFESRPHKAVTFLVEGEK